MKKLLINPDSELITRFLERYKIWKDYKNCYGGEKQEYLAEIDACGIHAFHYTEISKINNSPSSVIVIDCLTEGLHSSKYFNRYSKDKHYIIFSNGIWSKDTANLDISYDVVPHLFFLFEMADTYLSPHRFCFYLDKTYKFDYPKPYMFTSTVGAVRPERSHFTDTLKEKIKYNNFILRYSGENLGVNANHLDVINFKKGQFDAHIKILEEYYHAVSQTLPINMYNQSYFNLVVETDIDFVDNFFLTEKTIKSLIVGMPFVMVTTPHFLKNLQKPIYH